MPQFHIGRAIHNRRHYVDALTCCPMKYKAHIYGLVGRMPVDIVGGTYRSEADAIHSAQVAAWAWLGGDTSVVACAVTVSNASNHPTI